MYYRKHKKIALPATRTNYVYGLCCPVSGAVKYVGWTSLDPTERLKAHMSVARRGDARRVYAWIRELSSPPVLTVLEVLPPGSTLVPSGSGYVRPATQAEKKWIAKFADSVLNEPESKIVPKVKSSRNKKSPPGG